MGIKSPRSGLIGLLILVGIVLACGTDPVPAADTDANQTDDGDVTAANVGGDGVGCECDDDDPCTTDGCIDAGVCTHEPAASGTICGEHMHCDKGACGPETMLLVPGGDFWQGCNEAIEGEHSCQHDEYPQHRSFVSAFWLARFEVSVSDYGKCVNAGGCTKPLHGAGAADHGELYNWGADSRAKHPINGIGWEQAMAYCKWRLPGGRLATESEWEKAARGACDLHAKGQCADAMQAYPWGNHAPDCDHAIIAVQKTDLESGFGCGKGRTWPVGSATKDKGPYGHMGLGGNVAEWIDSCYVADFYEQFKTMPAVDAKSPCDIEGLRGVRGGGFYEPGFDSRASFRHGHPPEQADYYVGIRCAHD